MSEVVTPVEPQKPQGEPEKDSTDWKAEARKWETRAKENKTAAEKLKELEDSQKSELVKAQELATQAVKDAQAAKAEAARLRIATKHGIGEDYLDLLTGSDEASLETKAEKISSLIKSGESVQKRLHVPKEGRMPKGQTTPSSWSGVLDAIDARRE